MAGYKNILLGAAYKPTTANPPVKIEANKANVISLELTSISPQWTGDNDTNDAFKFSAAIDAVGTAEGIDETGDVTVTKTPRLVTLAPGAVPANSDTFTVTFKTAALGPLLTAAGGSSLTVEDFNVVMWGAYVTDNVTTVPNLWTIRNGLTIAQDTGVTGIGGLFPVKIGEGTSTENKIGDVVILVQ
ncbi:MAG: hypothetical protein LBP81_06310 [Treponema sp.]|nr:hypothetical protein [Treponema sp.]